MSDRYPCGTLKRRHFLGAATASALGASLWNPSASANDKTGDRLNAGPAHYGPKPDGDPRFAAPGLYPGRVVEVKNPAMIQNKVKNREAIKASLNRGMTELTGADDAAGAWRTFFEPGDVVGIKVVPNGWPHAFSSIELVLETIEGLKSAGVKTRDIFVFDRFRGELIQAGYDKALPAEIRFGGLTAGGGGQTAMDFKGFENDPTAGYDRDAYVYVDLIQYGEDPGDDRQYRSHLGKLLTRVVNKVVSIPCLKDHRSAGITGALKNISHGSVNNVARSHANAFTNVCNQFIPQIATHPILRSKHILHIMDGVRGVYHGGPMAIQDGRWTWDNNALLFATDPVAMDRLQWGLIDARRALENLPPVAASGKTGLDPEKTEDYDIRQPQHIALAHALGLGRYELKGASAIQHSVVNL